MSLFLHKQIDVLGALTPRIKLGLVLAIVAVILGILGLFFYLGVRAGDGWSSSSYIRQRDENLIKARNAEAEADKLAAENVRLKAHNEQVAAKLAEVDKERAAREARDLIAREKTRQEMQAAIDRQQTPDEVICGTCQAALNRGEPLSNEFCGRCWPQP